MKNKRKILIISISIVAALAIIFGVCAIYLGDYYRADEGAIAVFAPEENVTVSTLDGGNVVFEPQNATVGFIFYPGGKVEANAYQPLMAELAREVFSAYLWKCPLISPYSISMRRTEYRSNILGSKIGTSAVILSAALWRRPILPATRTNMRG